MVAGSLKFHCTCLETDYHLHFRLCCSDSFCRFCQSPAWSFAILEWWSHFSRICWWGWYCLEYIYKRNQNIISWYTNGVNTCNSIQFWLVPPTTIASKVQLGNTKPLTEMFQFCPNSEKNWLFKQNKNKTMDSLRICYIKESVQ